MMRIAFVVPGLERSGGMDVIRGHAERLQASGAAEVDLVPLAEVASAAGQHYDVALGTWWETFHRLFDLEADRYAAFVQSFEQRFYLPAESGEQLAAGFVYHLPLHFIGVSSWICEALEQLRPDATCARVPNGIDKTVFTPGERNPDAHFRVLIDGQPEVWFKGVDDAVAAARGMDQRAHITLACLQPPSSAALDIDRVVSGLSPAEMARLYRETDVVLKLSRVEGLGLVPIEAFHCGTPCVVTPYTGHEDYVRHGENGLVCGFDDLRTASAYLDRLATDTELLERLRTGSLKTAAEWPSAEESTRLLDDALRAIASAPPPQVDRAAWARQLAYSRLALDVGREERARYENDRERLRNALEQLDNALAAHDRLKRDVDNLTSAFADKQDELDSIHASRAYRFSLQLRRITRGR